MHSRRSQSQRTRVADQFREGSNLIMFSSDVSARGMDYPDVTAVIQVGMPSERAQYIHRLGRTGRAGKQGGGYLLLAEEERPALKMLADLPITTRAPLDAPSAAALTADVAEGMLRVSAATKQASYQVRGRCRRRATPGPHLGRWPALAARACGPSTRSLPERCSRVAAAC